MEDNSELHPESLRIQCNKAIEVIDKENEAYEELISKLRTNIVENDTMSGETADSIKAYASDLIFVVEYAIEANELDKVDHQTFLNEIDSVLADKVDVNEVLRGYEIHEEINYLEEQISIYEEYINQEILNLNINDLNEIKEVEYREQIEDLESVLQDYKNKEERYDTIEAETKTLFSSTSEIRGIATAAIHEMKGSLINDEYKPSANPRWKGKFKIINNSFFSKNDIYNTSDSHQSKIVNFDEVKEYIKEYLLNHGIPEEIIETIKPEILRSLYTTLIWSERDANVILIKIIKDIYGELYVYLKEKYFWDNFITEESMLILFNQDKLDSLYDYFCQKDYVKCNNIIEEICKKNTEGIFYNEWYFPEEYETLLKDLEQGPYGLEYLGCGYYEEGVLRGIYPHYVGDGGITFGYGHYISESECLIDSSEMALYDEYIPNGTSFDGQGGTLVPDAKYMPIEIVDEIFESDVRIQLDHIVPWLEENGIELKSNELWALVIYRFQNGSIEPLFDLLRTNNRNPDDWYLKWSLPENRRDTCQNLFFQ